jgi:hypothetical protein
MLYQKAYQPQCRWTDVLADQQAEMTATGCFHTPLYQPTTIVKSDDIIGGIEQRDIEITLPHYSCRIVSQLFEYEGNSRNGSDAYAAL